jgi:2-polyprenyl-3-methyl-5-hydroxy-6-metoxy-1,4-benzoquinol methylase
MKASNKNLSLICGVDLFPYPYKNLSGNTEWNRRLQEAAGMVFHKLKDLRLQELEISDYQKNYLGNYLRRLHYGMETGIFILSHVFDGLQKRPENSILLDHGAGSGILSLLAKAAGVGKVVYEDIYDISCQDAATIGRALDLEADYYLHGDEEAIKVYFRQLDGPDVIISRNVIEHVYRPESLVHTIAGLHSHPMQIFFATTANKHNPAVNLYTRRLHHRVEKQGFHSRWDKGSDARKPMLEIRSAMIGDMAPELDEHVIKELAIHTRGLIRPAIQMAVEEYRSHGKLPPMLSDPSNTCDPETGNWAERLTSISEYRDIFEENEFQFHCIPGFYDTHYTSALANLLATCLNPCIRLLGSKGVKLSPFIGLKASRGSAKS